MDYYEKTLKPRAVKLMSAAREHEDISCVIFIETPEKVLIEVQEGVNIPEKLKSIIASLNNYLETINDNSEKRNNDIEGAEST